MSLLSFIIYFPLIYFDLDIAIQVLASSDHCKHQCFDIIDIIKAKSIRKNEHEHFD